MESEFVPRKNVLEKLNIHYHTLYRMIERGDIEYITIGKKNYYNLNKYLLSEGIINNDKRKNICYCRVSSPKQKNDLGKQIDYMKLKYPNHEIISDIGSGLNYKRKGLVKLIDMAIKGEIKELVIAYKDRLMRFGYEIMEDLIKKYSKGEIKILNKTEEQTPQEEMTKDIISIMNVYVAKVNGLRKYKKKITNEIKNKSE